MTKTALKPGWWITTGRLDQDGEPVLGPFVDRDLALEVRRYVEAAARRNDLWVQEVDKDGVPLW